MRALLLGGPKLIQILSERPLIELGQKPLLGGRIDFADFVHQLTFWHGRFTFDSRKKTRPGLSRPSGRESVIQMPELEQANQQDDPIAALHRMSTTAGVGSQDYVAINNLAIAAALLGLGTALAFVHVFFVILGLAGIVCGTIAILQIRNSNGTQGGKALGWLGIVLSVALAGVFAASSAAAWTREQEDRHQIDDVIVQLGKAVMAGDYSKAHSLFDEDFRKRWPLAPFETKWKEYQNPDFAGKLTEMYGNNQFSFFSNANGNPLADTQAVVRFEKSTNSGRFLMRFRKYEEGWKIISMEIFDARGPSAAPPAR